jgi:CMP-2-keto-3-deoxyoctulosonic acid synthetase
MRTFTASGSERSHEALSPESATAVNLRGDAPTANTAAAAAVLEMEMQEAAAAEVEDTGSGPLIRGRARMTASTSSKSLGCS